MILKQLFSRISMFFSTRKIQMFNPFTFILHISFLICLAESSFTYGCIGDFNIQQRSMPSNLNSGQLQQLFELASQNQPQKGWALLGQWGDPYAHLAAQVLDPQARRANKVYHRLINTHWRNVVGKEMKDLYFDQVALQHYSQYISIIKRTSNWPDSDQILLSYLQAARDHGLPDLIVFDAAWDAAGYNLLRTWQSLNHLEKNRTIEPTNVCYKIDSADARQILFRDLNFVYSGD